MTLAVRSTASEQMDDADLDPATYAAILTDLAQVNRLALAARPTLSFLNRAMGERKRFRLLDVGFGDGDMLRSIARWADRRGLVAELIGIDLNPRSESVARAATLAAQAIDYRTGDYALLAGGGFDFIVSSLVAHHMDEAQLIAFLRFMEAEAARGWLVNDLHRHRLAHMGYPLLARMMGWHRIVREDGTLSIARSFRPAEWGPLLAAAGIDGARRWCGAFHSGCASSACASGRRADRRRRAGRVRRRDHASPADRHPAAADRAGSRRRRIRSAAASSAGARWRRSNELGVDAARAWVPRRSAGCGSPAGGRVREAVLPAAGVGLSRLACSMPR